VAKRLGKAESLYFVFTTTKDPEYVMSYFVRDLKLRETKVTRNENSLDIDSAYLSGVVGLVVFLLAATLILAPLAIGLRKAAESRTKLRITASPTQEGSSVIVTGTLLSSLMPSIQTAFSTLQMS
jgi:hypothetical protein